MTARIETRKPARRTVDGRSPWDRYFNRRRHLSLDQDRSQHRRFAALYDDLMS